MRVAIIGGNSQIGTELSFLYRADGHEVEPIVRSERSTWFLDHHGFDCTVADITDPTQASEALSEADIVVVSAFAGQFNRRGFRPKEARAINERLAQNSVEAASPGATVVYLSTIHAFGKAVGPSTWTSYGVEKRHVEETLLEAAEGTATNAYPFRLGQVFGVNQGKTEAIVEPIAADEYDGVAVDPDRPSNVVHTVTIRDATYAAHDGAPTPQRYTVVNRPQWTWRDVYEYHLPDSTRVTFHPSESDSSSLPMTAFRACMRVARPYSSVLRTLLLYAPQFITIRISQYSRRSTVGDSIADLERDELFHTHEFDYDPAPGPELDGVRETRTAMSEYEPHLDAFDPVGFDV